MAPFDNSALFREDPFGVNDYAVNFSLNKKKRWEISEEIAGRIEEVQVCIYLVERREFNLILKKTFLLDKIPTEWVSFVSKKQVRKNGLMIAFFWFQILWYLQSNSDKKLFQDTDKKLRVSASVHTHDVSQNGYWFSGTPRDLGWWGKPKIFYSNLHNCPRKS